MNSFKLYGTFSALLLAIVLILPQASFAVPEKGQPVPPFQVVTTSGQKVSLANYKGYVLVIEFFATYCGGCKESIPHLLDLQKQFGKQGLQILGFEIGEGHSLDDVKSFIAKRKISYPVAMVDMEVAYNTYGIRSMPSLFVINKKGVLVENFNFFDEKIMERTVRKLVAE